MVATENNRLEIVNFLVENGNVFRDDIDEAIQLASAKGYSKIVDFLYEN